MTREKTTASSERYPNFRTGFEQPLKFLFFRNRFRIILHFVPPRWESECAFICASGQDATGPSRCRPDSVARDEAWPRKRMMTGAEGGRPKRSSNTVRSSVFGQVEPGSAPAGIRQAVNPARAERRRRLRLWSGSAPAIWAGPLPCADASAHGLPGCDKHTGAAGAAFRPVFRTPSFKGSAKKEDRQARGRTRTRGDDACLERRRRARRSSKSEARGCLTIE